MRHDIKVIIGKIVTGSGQANRLGFPTVNIAYGALPDGVRNGVYAAELVAGEQAFPGAACLGAGVINGLPKLEIHCFEPAPVKPGDPVQCRLITFLRELVPYESDDQMRRLIAGDAEQAKGFFGL